MKPIISMVMLSLGNLLVRSSRLEVGRLVDFRPRRACAATKQIHRPPHQSRRPTATELGRCKNWPPPPSWPVIPARVSVS